MRLFIVIKLSLLVGIILSATAAPRTTVERGPHFVGDSVNVSIVIPGTREPHQVDLAPLSHLEARILEAAPLPASAEPAFLIRIRILATETGTFDVPPLRVSGPTGTWQTAAQQFQVSLPSSSDEIRLRQSSERTQVYVGEPFVVAVEWEFDTAITAIHAVDLRLPWLTQHNLRIIEPRTLPPLPGNDIGLPVSGTRVIAKVEGRTIRFQRIVVASEPGEITLAPATILASRSLQPGPARGGSFQYPAYFDNQFFNAPSRGNFERIFTRSEPVTIEVLALPGEGKPTDFSGIVGAFSLNASIQPDRGFVGSPLQLELRAEHYPFPEALQFPKLAEFPGFSGRFNLPPDRGLPALDFAGGAWVRSVRQSIRPLSTGVEFVPAITINYFNPESGRYETTTSERLPLRIESARMASIFEATLDDGSRLRNRLKANEQGFAALFRSDALQTFTNGRLPLSSPRYWLLAMGMPILLALALLSASHRLRLTRHNPKAARAFYASRDFRRNLRKASDDRARLQALKQFFADRLGCSAKALTPGSIRRDLQRAGLKPEDFATSLKVLTEVDRDTYGPKANGPVEIDWQTTQKEVVRSGSRCALPSEKGILASITRPQWLPLWLGLTAIILIGSVTGSNANGPSPLPDEAMQQAERFFLSGLERHLDEPAEAKADFERAAALYELALEYSQHSIQRARLHYNASSARFFSEEKGRALVHLLAARQLAPHDSPTRRAIAHIRSERVDQVPTAWQERLLLTPISLTKQFSQTSQRTSLTLGFIALCLLVVSQVFTPSRARRRSSWVLASLLLLAALVLIWEHQLLHQPDRGVVVVGEAIPREGNGLLYPPALQTPIHDGFEFRIIEQRGEWLAIDAGGTLPVMWLQAEQIQRVSAI